MSLLAQVVLFSLLGGLLSVAAAGVFLLLPERWRTHVLPHFVSYAIGAMLGAAFLGLLPEAIESAGAEQAPAIFATVLAGLFGFFLLEKFVLWHHCHDEVCEGGAHVHTHGSHASGVLILVGDGIHNFVDGVLIAAAFLTDAQLGILTAIAVAAHEIPQEVGDFAILLHSGFTTARAFVFNMLSSLTTILGAVLAWLTLSDVQAAVPYVVAVAAASFIYIAVADLIPGLHRKVNVRATLQQAALILAGVATIYVSEIVLH
ncbi:MAG TPA: ZIP family metal transporter [Geothrix sp.]|nr:ZIP family metal transporter [Geothrix sp.]